MAAAATLAHASYGVDTIEILTVVSAKSLRAANYQGHPIDFAVRYLSIEAEGGWDIKADEVAAIMASGLALLLVQHVREENWVPSVARGTSDGTWAAKNAAAVGYAKGCTISVDLEGVLPGTSPSVVIGYINAWADAIIAAGYTAMVYVGYNTMLDPEQLYLDLPNVHLYWSDFGARDVAVRGFCMKQLSNTTTLAGVPFGVDPDRITPDAKGGLPTWMVDAAA